MNRLKLLLTRKNVANLVMVLIAIVLIISPQAKAILIMGMLKLGLMRAPTESTAPAKTAPALNILLRSADGEILQTSQQRGKVLIVNFWATWCPPCIAEMPSIDKMYRHYQNNAGIMVLPVDVDGNLSRSSAFMKDHHYGLPVYQVDAGLPEGVFSGSIPTTLIINKHGQIVARHEGAADYSDKAFYDYLNKLLQAP
jgi:thiol-disulfide isomerase/thioredoxin